MNLAEPIAKSWEGEAIAEPNLSANIDAGGSAGQKGGE